MNKKTENKNYELTEQDKIELDTYMKAGYKYIVLVEDDLFLLSKNKPECEPLPYGGMKWSGVECWQYITRIGNMLDMIGINQCILISDLMSDTVSD